MSGRYPGGHLCEDCGAWWPCYDRICDDAPLTVCAACVEARERWAWEQQARQALQEDHRADHCQ